MCRRYWVVIYCWLAILSFHAGSLFFAVAADQFTFRKASVELAESSYKQRISNAASEESLERQEFVLTNSTRSMWRDAKAANVERRLIK